MDPHGAEESTVTLVANVSVVDAIEPQITDALNLLTEEYNESIEEITTEMQPCDHCRNQKYETYVLLAVLRRAFVRTLRES